MEEIQYLKDTNIFGDMTEADLRVLSGVTYRKGYNRRDQVYGQSDPSDVVYLLKKGRVKIYKLSPEGKELTLAIREPCEIFGEMALVDQGPRDAIAEALEDTILYVIRCRDFELLLKKKPQLTMQVTKLIGHRRRELENQLESLVFRNVSSRLAILLLSLAEKHGISDSQGVILNIKLAQQELANLIGTARETTSATLNEFKRLGIIDIQCRRIKVLDRSRLKEIAVASFVMQPF